MIGQRVRDKISDQTGTVTDTFWNQAIVRWDAADEDGNYVSSVPAIDLQEESDAGSPAQKNTDAATETPTNKKESVMTQNTKTPATVRELGDLAHAAGVTPSEYLGMIDYSECYGTTVPFRTPQPDWATSTETGVSLTKDWNPICSHYGELFDSPEVSVSIVRDDVLTNGKAVIGETKVVLNSADQLEVDADALAAIGQGMIAAAHQIRQTLGDRG